MRTILAAAAVLALGGCDAPPAEPRVTVERAWVQLPVVPGRPGAAYFTLRTNNNPMKLVAVSSPRIGRIELHESSMSGGMAQMKPLTDTMFPDHQVLDFAPSGKHAMLFDVDPGLKPGDTISLAFTFEPAPPVTVQAEVRAFGQSHGSH